MTDNILDGQHTHDISAMAELSDALYSTLGSYGTHHEHDIQYGA